MKKWILVGTALLLMGYLELFPFQSTDAGELLVIETLLIEEADGEIYMYGLNMEGTGHDIRKAAQDMSDSAPGQLFLRQTKRVIFCGDTEISLLELPEEIPVGTIIYQDERSGKQLSGHLETLEQQLAAREKREKTVPTLAQLLNQQLAEDHSDEDT